jgi:tetratricopeptide (TPR) repeat protein
MISKRTLVIFSLLLFVTGNFFPQNIDSLKEVAFKAGEDSSRCSALVLLIELENDDKIWQKYNEELKRISEKNLKTLTKGDALYYLYSRYLASYYHNKGFYFDNLGDINEALKYYNKSLFINDRIHNKKELAGTLINIGLIHYNQGNIMQALEDYNRCLKIYEELNEKVGVAQSLNNLAFAYNHQGEEAKALEYYQKSMKLQEELNDLIGLSTSLSNLGSIYVRKGDKEKGLEYFGRSLKIRTELGDRRGVAACLKHIGTIYKSQGELDEALDNYKQSLTIYEEVENKSGISFVLADLSSLFLMTADYQKAIDCAERGLKLSKELGFPENISSHARLLRDVYKRKGDYKKAYDMFELYQIMEDSVSNENTRKATVKQQMKYEYTKKAIADSVENMEKQKIKDAQIALQESKLKQEKTRRYTLYFGLAMTGAFLIFMVNRFRVTRKQKKIIEDQKKKVDEAFSQLATRNKEVLDSIHYAKRIQSSLLPSEKFISKTLEKSKKN